MITVLVFNPLLNKDKIPVDLDVVGNNGTVGDGSTLNKFKDIIKYLKDNDSYLTVFSMYMILMI